MKVTLAQSARDFLELRPNSCTSRVLSRPLCSVPDLRPFRPPEMSASKKPIAPKPPSTPPPTPKRTFDMTKAVETYAYAAKVAGKGPAWPAEPRPVGCSGGRRLRAPAAAGATRRGRDGHRGGGRTVDRARAAAGVAPAVARRRPLWEQPSQTLDARASRDARCIGTMQAGRAPCRLFGITHGYMPV